MEAMNTSRTPISTPATGRPFHSSTRTALSLNTDAATGQLVQTMTTSQLELAWVAGELRIIVDGKDILYVVDVVTFNTDGKIKAIRAFIGRGD